MTDLFTQTLAICAAAILAFGSIGAIVAVPPAHAGAPLVAAELA